MTPEQHNKYLAYSHLGYAGLTGLMMFLGLGFFAAAFGLSRVDPNGPPLGLFLVLCLFVAVVTLVTIIPSFIAGYGLLKGKKWARTASIVAGVLAAMRFPIGSAVCVYTFWLLFSEPGKAIFDPPRYALPPGRQAWVNDVRQEKEVQYTPPSSPPDWR